MTTRLTSGSGDDRVVVVEGEVEERAHRPRPVLILGRRLRPSGVVDVTYKRLGLAVVASPDVDQRRLGQPDRRRLEELNRGRLELERRSEGEGQGRVGRVRGDERARGLSALDNKRVESFRCREWATSRATRRELSPFITRATETAAGAIGAIGTEMVGWTGEGGGRGGRLSNEKVGSNEGEVTAEAAGDPPIEVGAEWRGDMTSFSRARLISSDSSLDWSLIVSSCFWMSWARRIEFSCASASAA